MASQESPALTTDARGNEEKKLSFLDLPTETKKEVFKHVGSPLGGTSAGCNCVVLC